MRIPTLSQIRCKQCVSCVLAFIVIESLVINSFVLYFLWSLRSIQFDLMTAPGESLLDKLASYSVFRDLVFYGKDGGFKSLLDQTAGRLYVEQNMGCYFNKNSDSDPEATQRLVVPSISRIAIDVSDAGEALYIMERIQSRFASGFEWSRLVVDIGANDGFMSSNSYNFIQCGWSAVLVEPQHSQLDLARRNLNGLTNQMKGQTVHFVQGVVSDRDGSVKLSLSSDIAAMESRILPDNARGGNYVIVPSYSVQTLTRTYSVPKRFGILSIDAEGQSNQILYQWMGLGFRPQFVIYECLHEKEPVSTTIEKMAMYGYTYLVKKGWNLIFEWKEETSSFDKQT